MALGGLDEGFGDALVAAVVAAAEMLPVPGLDAVQAGETPVGVGELFDEGSLGGVLGRVGGCICQGNRNRVVNRIEWLLETVNVKLGSVISDIVA